MAWAKVLLPLAALALLSTLFLLVARRPGARPTIPFAEIEAIARDPRIDAPAPRRGRPRRHRRGARRPTASCRSPGSPTASGAVAPRLETRSPSGPRGDGSRPPTGEVLGPTRTLRLTGGVALDAESPAAGPLAVRTGAVTADLATGIAHRAGRGRGRRRGSGTLTARGDAGRAGHAPRADGGARVVFNGAVRLVYVPPAPPPAPAAAGGAPP